MWLGAPQLKIKMTDFARPPGQAALEAAARNQSAQNKESAPSPVRWMNWRRLSAAKDSCTFRGGGFEAIERPCVMIALDNQGVIEAGGNQLPE
jgi:hypothetical protein